ncbi:hypothetical protein SKAU_G00158880 [Synaphobranchus kaupii]|uniref:BHLH domain-containing protein n=1 Tax=Synaphobranchus kaupii TaxID=118154 RepID=A0A9Q1FI45_SYNKA|nr:hypothetical protein SKAU_G00158880 [Synaphobranchus kaupii]
MAPTVPAALSYSEEHLILSNKLRKPMVEKLRRDRINSSIEQLKSLLGPAFLQQQPDCFLQAAFSKLEKAGTNLKIIKAVFFLKQQQQQPSSNLTCSVSQRYSRCVQEIKHFLSRDVVTPETTAEPFPEPAALL